MAAAALLESTLLPLPPMVPCGGRGLPDRLVSGGCGAGCGGQTPCLGLNDRVSKSGCRPRLPQAAVVRVLARAGFGSAWARKHGCISGLAAGPGCTCGRIRVDVGVRRPGAVCRLLRCPARGCPLRARLQPRKVRVMPPASRGVFWGRHPLSWRWLRALGFCPQSSVHLVFLGGGALAASWPVLRV